jgi:hypothetical protein
MHALGYDRLPNGAPQYAMAVAQLAVARFATTCNRRRNPPNESRECPHPRNARRLAATVKKGRERNSDR